MSNAKFPKIVKRMHAESQPNAGHTIADSIAYLVAICLLIVVMVALIPTKDSVVLFNAGFGALSFGLILILTYKLLRGVSNFVGIRPRGRY